MEVLLDRYEVLGQLGSGGLAEILRVRDRAVPGRVVALKRQHAHVSGPELLEEFRALVQVQHANLPAVFDYHEDLGDGRHGYTLEEVSGETADKVAEAMGADCVPDIAVGLLRALAHIHARGLVHGDLHPHNLIAGKTGSGLAVKVLDLSPGTPRSGGMGALPYLAPERLEGQPPSADADLFSVGVTLHRLLTGALPYPDYPHMPDSGPEGADALGPWQELVCSLMARKPADRPRRATDVLVRIEALRGDPAPLVTPSIVRTTLRRGPMRAVGDWPAALTNTVTELLTGGGAGVVAIEGALGSGRSRALRELKWTLQSRVSTRVVSAAGHSGDPSGALARRLLTQVPAEARSGLPAHLASTVDALAGDTLLGGSADPAKARTMAVDNLARALLWLGRRGPVAVLADDLDQADPLSADVLAAVARNIAHRPDDAGSLVLVTAGPAGDALDALMADAGAAGTRLTPPPFDEEAVDGLVRTAFAGLAASRRLTTSLVRISGGNPLVISEAVASAVDQGFIEIGDDDVHLSEDAPSPLPVPTSATDAVLGRLSAVSDSQRPLLALIAAASTPVPAALAAPAFGVDEATAGHRIESLRALGLVRWQVDEGEARLAPVTPSLREALMQQAPDKAMLARLATLDASGLSLAGRVVRAEAVLALGAGEAGEKGALAVARELMERGKAAEALGLMTRLRAPDFALLGDAHATLGNDDDALDAWSELPEDQAAERAGVLLVRRGRNPEALERLGGLDDKLSPDALAWLARAHMMQSDYASALAVCDRADALADERLAPRIGYVRGLVEFYRGDYPAAATAFEAALAAWKELGDPIEQATVVNALGLVHFRQAELGPALDQFTEAIKLAEKAGDRERMTLTLMNVAIIHQERGEYGLAESRYREMGSMAAVLGHRSGVMKVEQNLGNLYRYLGELSKARGAIEASQQIAAADGNQYIVCHNRTLLGEVAWLDDRLDEAQEHLEAALKGFLEVGSVNEAADCRRSLAVVLLDRGDVEGAREHARGALRAAQEHGVPRLEALARLTLADAERRAVDGDLDQALTQLEKAREKLGATPRPDLHWQLLLGMHRVRRARGEGDRAREVGVEALGALRELADKLPEARRATFLAVRNRRDARRELQWLDDLSGKGGEEAGASKLHRLLDVNQRLTQELDLSRLLEYIIDSAILLSGAERGFLLMSDPKVKDGLKIVVARNIDQENIRNKRYKVSYNIAERVIESGEAVLTTDAMGDDRYSEYLSIHHLKLRSVLCLPMSRAGKAIGALYVDNRFQRNAFSDQDMEFMEAFANQAGIALTNARLLEERENTARELAKSQEEVQELNKKLEAQLVAKQRELEETEQLLRVQRRQLERTHGYESIVGDSDALRQVFHVLDRVCKSEVPVLVTGGSGTGKELVARAVHYNGPRKERPFIAINCSSIPETLIESELFGHVRGAFTGATSDKKGVFEVAHRGTLFLDEIGEMPVEMQAKLLRALQEGEIQKVGSARTVKVDVRILAATNRDLREMIAEKRFREDLYYRLAVVTIPLPSLQQRRDDIPLLVKHFIEQNKKAGLGRVREVSAEALRLLMRYDWPGNVRELETVMKNASIFCEGEVLQPSDFSNFPGIVGTDSSSDRGPAPQTSVVRPLSELEREAIIYALEANRGNKKKTAEQLGIDRRTLYNKLSAYGISIERRAHVLGRDS